MLNPSLSYDGRTIKKNSAQFVFIVFFSYFFFSLRMCMATSRKSLNNNGQHTDYCMEFQCH